MVIREKYSESLFYAIISELVPSLDNFENRNKIYNRLCKTINSCGFVLIVPFSEIKFDNNSSYYESLINEFNKCFDKSVQKQNNIQSEGYNEFENKFEILKYI
jgi:hypothetical protein